MKSVIDYILAVECGITWTVILLWGYMTFKFPMYKYISGWWWGAIFGISVVQIIILTALYFKGEVK